MQKFKKILEQLKFCCSGSVNEKEEENQIKDSPLQCMSTKQKDYQQSGQKKNFSQQDQQDQQQESPRFKDAQQSKQLFQHSQLGNIEINKQEIEEKIREPKMRRVTVKGQLQRMDSGEALEQIQRKIKKQQTLYTRKKNQKIEKYIEKNFSKRQKTNDYQIDSLQFLELEKKNISSTKTQTSTNRKEVIQCPSFEQERDQQQF